MTWLAHHLANHRDCNIKGIQVRILPCGMIFEFPSFGMIKGCRVWRGLPLISYKRKEYMQKEKIRGKSKT